MNILGTSIAFNAAEGGIQERGPCQQKFICIGGPAIIDCGAVIDNATSQLRPLGMGTARGLRWTSSYGVRGIERQAKDRRWGAAMGHRARAAFWDQETNRWRGLTFEGLTSLDRGRGVPGKESVVGGEFSKGGVGTSKAQNVK